MLLCTCWADWDYEAMRVRPVQVMHELRRMEKPVVFDADSLHLVKNNLDLMRGWRNAFLTPNRNEFQRLASAFDIEVDPKEPTKQLQQVAQHCSESWPGFSGFDAPCLNRALGSVKYPVPVPLPTQWIYARCGHVHGVT